MKKFMEANIPKGKARKYRVIITECVEHEIFVEAEDKTKASTKTYEMFLDDESQFKHINYETTDIEVYECLGK